MSLSVEQLDVIADLVNEVAPPPLCVSDTAVTQLAPLLLELKLLRESREELEKVLTAASHALRSYQYGNSSEELAEEMADACDAALANAAKVAHET